MFSIFVSSWLTVFRGSTWLCNGFDENMHVCWQKLMAVEDVTEEERRETHDKLEMLQSVVRTFELKAKNTQDHSE